MKYISILKDKNKFDEIIKDTNLEYYIINNNWFGKSISTGYRTRDYFLIVSNEEEVMYLKIKDPSLNFFEIKNDNIYEKVTNYIKYIICLSTQITMTGQNRVQDYILMTNIQSFESYRTMYDDPALYSTFYNFKNNLQQNIDRYNQEESEIMCFEINMFRILK